MLQWSLLTCGVYSGAYLIGTANSSVHSSGASSYFLIKEKQIRDYGWMALLTLLWTFYCFLAHYVATQYRHILIIISNINPFENTRLLKFTLHTFHTYFMSDLLLKLGKTETVVEKRGSL